jgi:hypothetical protein
MPAAEAARRVGFSTATATRILAKLRDDPTDAPGVVARRQPDPKAWELLSVDAQAALADFNVFRELFFADRPQVWAHDASMRIVEALADETQRTFIDLNVFPGAGKSTVGLRLGCWLIAGGGFCDPRRGRAMRLMYGGETMTVSTHMVKAIRNFLSLRHPFRDIERDVEAKLVLGLEYGRFRPIRGFDPDTQWTESQFVVAQMTEVELYDKEPTAQAASYKSGFLGERANFAWWDDIATTKNSSAPRPAEAVATFFTNEAERRVEPKGVCVLVGQRLTALDLHRKRLDALRKDGTKLYNHIIYPAHHDRFCDGLHRQWDGRYELGAGCMTDIERLPVTDWENVTEDANYRTVFQQEDVDPEAVLVRPAWLQGGDDGWGFDAPGCYDEDRAFGDHPPREVGHLVDYATVDPSSKNWWGIEWWAYQPESRFNYLIWGERRKMAAGKLLDWDNSEQSFTGIMEDVQAASVLAGHAIRCWVIETNIAQRHLLEYEHYRRWRKRWPDVAVIKHETQLNKLDPDYGVSILSTRYRTGHKRLPHKQGLGFEGRNFMRVMEKELTTYPFAETTDTVMADWMGEYNLPRIVQAAKRQPGQDIFADARLPKYLRDQSRSVPVGT